MPGLGGRPRLSLEAAPNRCLAGQLRSEQLYRDEPIEAVILGETDPPPAPSTEALPHLVAPTEPHPAPASPAVTAPINRGRPNRHSYGIPRTPAPPRSV